MNFSGKLHALLAELNKRHDGSPLRNPRTIAKTLADIPTNGNPAQQFSWGGMSLQLSGSSHASAAVQVAFDELPANGDDSLWFNLNPCEKVRRPDGLPFARFFARLQPGVAQSELRRCVFVIDPDPASGVGDSITAVARAGNVTVGGKMQVECGFQNAAGADVSAIASNEGALAVAGFDGVNYTRIVVDTTGRQVVVGAAASNAAATGNPVLIGGVEGATGQVKPLPIAIDGNAPAGPAVVCAGWDGTNAHITRTDTSGRVVVVGAVADGAAVAGNPVLVAGYGTGNAKTLQLNTTNQLITIDGTSYRLLCTSQGAQATTTLWSAAVVGVGGTSATFQPWGLRRVEIFGNVSAATTLTVQFSADGVTFYDATSGAAAGQTPNNVLGGAGNFSLSFDTGAGYLRLKSSAAATITAIAMAKS